MAVYNTTVVLGSHSHQLIYSPTWYDAKHQLHPVLSAYILILSLAARICLFHLLKSKLAVPTTLLMSLITAVHMMLKWNTKPEVDKFVAFRLRGLFFAIIYGSFNKNVLSSCSHQNSLLLCSSPHRSIFRGLNKSTCLLDHSGIKNEGKQEEEGKWLVS